ncbi:MAG: hypothetical protein M0C28_48440 [Candidatus Moduliflexus flocculans]|nr:hypothetical protein [Candidatus Moduliflexus flocculans]
MSAEERGGAPYSPKEMEWVKNGNRRCSATYVIDGLIRRGFITGGPKHRTNMEEWAPRMEAAWRACSIFE